jgi:methyl coenzyme M reductase beta subunit
VQFISNIHIGKLFQYLAVNNFAINIVKSNGSFFKVGNSVELYYELNTFINIKVHINVIFEYYTQRKMSVWDNFWAFTFVVYWMIARTFEIWIEKKINFWIFFSISSLFDVDAKIVHSDPIK